MPHTIDDVFGRAAQLGFYFLLALFPALLGVTALIGMLPSQVVLPTVMPYAQEVLPAESLILVDRYVEQVIQGSGRGVFSLSLLGSLWAAILGDDGDYQYVKCGLWGKGNTTDLEGRHDRSVAHDRSCGLYYHVADLDPGRRTGEPMGRGGDRNKLVGDAWPSPISMAVHRFSHVGGH